jgi:ATP-dependent RNA helicase RhlE
MPDDIRRLVQSVLHDPVTVKIGQSAPVESVSHALFPVQPHLKTALLKEILRSTETESVLVFTRTKHRVDRVVEQLSRAGYKVAGLQGDMTQYRRQEAMDGFRDGSLKILVATDIAARGLDVLSISHVINYDMPDTTDAYTHRIGRTGRVNNTGEAFTLVTREDQDMIDALERIFKKPIETRTVPGFNYSAEAPKLSAGRSGRSSFRPAVNPARRDRSAHRGSQPRRERSFRRERVTAG